MIVATLTTRNECPTIADTVRLLLREVDFVVIVDAGSTDGTPDSAERAGAEVIRCDRVGIGTGTVLAWRRALAMRATHVVQLDAGGSHSPDYIPAMMSVLRSTRCDIVAGSRFLPHSRYVGGPWWRRVGSRLMSELLSAATGVRHTDWTGGYRIYTSYAIGALVDYPYRLDMHGWHAEALIPARLNGLEVVDIPITYRAGRSSFRWRYVIELIRCAPPWALACR